MKLMRIIGLVVLLAVMGSRVVAASEPPKIISYETKGNLAATAEIGCAKSAKLSNTATPVDLYRGVAVCIKDENYADSAFLFALAGVYGRFDTFRVADRTAHQAMTVMVMGVLGGLDEARKEKFSAAVQKLVGSPDGLRATCKEARRIGAPAYHPAYMINHGIKAFSGGAGKNGLVEPFDAKAAWVKALDSYLHCPG